MELAYLYTRPRSTFGGHCSFKNIDARTLHSIASQEFVQREHIPRRPMILKLDTSPVMSEHEVNTEQLVMRSTSMRHAEGGWPKDVDIAEQSDMQRFRKKLEKDEDYKVSIKALGPIVDQCLQQNNTVDIYQDYLEHMGQARTIEPPSAKGLTVLRDPEPVKRTIRKIDWHPEHAQKLAACYSFQQSQDSKFTNARMPFNFYVWDILHPNAPESTLRSAIPLLSLKYNPKSVDQIVAGAYNGVVAFYDLRKSGYSPADMSTMEHSHHDPVFDVFWISSKTGNQCCSVSTDGSMLWWDIRHLNQPTHKVLLTDKDGMNFSGSCMEYNAEAGPTKYLIGTEQGVVLSLNLRNAKQNNNGMSVYDTAFGKHHGPIYSIQRNPSYPKFFLTIGDWTARLWCEDLKTPIMSTVYHNSYVTSGCWSPTRAGVFFVSRMDGVVDVWDIFYRQNEVAYSHKVGDVPLSSVAVQTNNASAGDLLAVGDSNGMISLLKLSEGLATMQTNEKNAISAMFDRETKREKILEAKDKESKRKKANLEERLHANENEYTAKDDKVEELLRTVDANFLSMIKEAEDSENEELETKSA